MSMSATKQAAEARIDSARADLLSLSHRLHAHPELSLHEDQASRWCGEMLSAAGFEVELGVGGLATALRASAGRGPLRVGLCAEYDALPEVGHACGHNIICAATVGAAIGCASVAEEAGLTVVVLGTPAEELYGLVDLPAGVVGPGKAALLEAGAFDELHVAMMCHPAPVDMATAHTRALTRVRMGFALGGEHVSPILAPRTSLLAVDEAVAICQTAALTLHAEAPAGCSIHLVRSNGCWGLNAHGERVASVDFGIWGEASEDVNAVADRLEAAARGVADATGTLAAIERFVAYAPMEHDADLAAYYRDNAVARGRSFPDLGALGDRLGMCTDMGNVSRRVPAIHPFISIETPALNHQPEFAAACASPSGDAAVMDGAIAMAWTAIDAATDPRLRGRLLGGPTLTSRA